jgi:drug/metabolite transporter, DME family
MRRLAIGGAACCLVSALGYTAVDICMRRLTKLQCNPSWAVFNKELVTSILVLPWLAWEANRRRPTFPSRRALARLLAVGLLIQVAGNVPMQWAFGIVGLAVSIPTVFGIMILAGAVMGRFWLREHVTIRSGVAIAMLLVSLLFLGAGAEAVGKSMATTGTDPSSTTIAWAVAACLLAGSVYAIMNIAIRHSVTGTTSPIAIALLLPLMGVVVLGPVNLRQMGLTAMLATSWEQVLLMIASGIFNLVGFLGLIYGLQKTTVVHANVLNASQVAMAALAGMWFFHEPPNPWVLLGIGLTVFGILWIDRPPQALDESLPP